MTKRKEKQIRIGKDERKLVDLLATKIKNYRIFPDQAKQREVKFNDRLMNHVRQNPSLRKITNQNIPTASFVKEQFRPEFYLNHKSKPLCAVECKRLIERSAKARWKEGLSQATLYSLAYKAVILVLLDFTEDSRFYKAFKRKNSVENRFKKKLQMENEIHIVVLKPVSR